MARDGLTSAHRALHLERLFVYGFVMSLPMLDNLSGLMNSQISLGLRILILIFAMAYVALHRPSFDLISLGFLIAFLAPSALEMRNLAYLSLNLGYLLKAVYCPALLLAFLDMKRRGALHASEIEKIVTNSLFIYAIFILIAFTTGYEIKNYGIGSRGFMIAGNDLGVIFLCAMPIAIKELIRRRTLRSWIVLVFIIGMSFLMLTKASMLASIEGLALTVFWMSRRIGRVRAFGLLVVLVALAVAGIAFVGPVIQKIIDYNQHIISTDGVQGFFFRGRLDVLGNSWELFRSGGIGQILFGKSPAEYQSELGQVMGLPFDLGVEMDLHYILFAWGILGLSSLSFFYTFFTAKLIKGEHGFAVLFPLAAIWAHSIFAGHVLLTPVSGTYLALFYTYHMKGWKWTS